MSEKPKRVRVNMRIPADLVEFIKEDARKRGTNMTGDFIEHLRSLKAKAEKEEQDAVK